MIVRDLVLQIQDEAEDMVSGHTVEAGKVRRLLSRAVQDLAAEEHWEFTQVALEPLIQTTTGTREYELPDDFPDNFVRSTNPLTGEAVHSVKVDDGSSASTPTFRTMSQFYQRDLSVESNGRPAEYTIVTNPGGGKNLILSPPPDSTGYTISGVYQPTNWKFEDNDEVPPLPSTRYLRYAVLDKLYPGRFREEFLLARAALYYMAAKQGPASLHPHPNMEENDAYFSR